MLGAVPGRPRYRGSDRSSSVSRPLASDQSPVAPRGAGAAAPGRCPRHGGHRRNPEPLVDLGPAGVVDACHHVGDLVGLPGDAHGEDVGVVAARDGGQRPGLVRPRLSRSSRSNPEPTMQGPSQSFRRRKARGLLSRTATEWPSLLNRTARPEPTRPQPTTTTCTAHSATRPPGSWERQSRRGTGLLLLCGRGHPHGVDLAALRRRRGEPASNPTASHGAAARPGGRGDPRVAPGTG